MIKLFLDTNILMSTILPERSNHIYAISIVLQNRIPLFTNDYVIKEVRRILLEYRFGLEDVEKLIEFFQTKIEVVKTPSKEELETIKAKDKSDGPIIKSAEKLDCVLVTDDTIAKRSAEKYVTAISSAEAVKLLGIKLARKPFSSLS